MAILHGSWLPHPQAFSQQFAQLSPLNPITKRPGGCLFIWGETWRRLTPTEETVGASDSETDPLSLRAMQTNPFAMTPIEFTEFLRSLQQSGSLNLPAADWLLSHAATSPTTAQNQAVENETPAKSSRRRSTTKTATAVETPPVATETPWQTLTIALPTTFTETTPIPRHSALVAEEGQFWLYPWQVQGLCLPPLAALQFLNSLPLGTVSREESFLGGDLRFWSHVARWSLDLLARSKFLPNLTRHSSQITAQWQALLDSGVDRARLEAFIDHMPAACRLYQIRSEAVASSEKPTASESSSPTVQLDSPLQLTLPYQPQALLSDFLNGTLDAQIRAVVATQPIAAARPTQTPAIEPTQKEWLQALGTETAAMEVNTVVDRLAKALEVWTSPLQLQQTEQNRFRACLYLHPPQYGQNWSLEFFLQAIDTPTFLIDAPTVWSNPVERLNYQGHTVLRPQETLLAGLGLASRLYSAIEPSLQEQRPQFCNLTPQQAYDFLKSVVWRLRDSGLGVMLPESLEVQGGWANRLGLRIQAQTAKAKKTDRLGLQSLLNFRWELTIGGQSLSKEQFDRLVALNMPLVEINGEWVELRTQDIKAAQSFFTSRKDQTTLSLEDALRISTGDTQMIEKLPVVGFEASGALQNLLTTLTGKRTVEELTPPDSFQGTLRPYQARGVGWLAFLEEWGLGACLADDMGLGKTIEFIAFLLYLKDQNKLESPTLLVCPTSVLGNWEREVKKFAPTLKAIVHHGDKRPKGQNFARAAQNYDLVITSYALIHRDLKDLQTVSWQGVVLDEAQNIKNADSKQSQAARQLDAQFRIALTGTPVENQLSELWSILDFLNPGYLGPKNFFQRRFAVPIERYGDTTSLQTLRSLVQPFILRRLKTDKEIIQDLPEKQEMTIFCGLTTEQAALYQRIVDQSLAKIEESEGIQRHGEILALLVKLKQVCNHPTLFLKDEGEGRKDEKDSSSLLPPSSFESRSGKLQRLEEMLEEALAEGDRALIFTQFAEWGKLLKAHLEKQLGRETLLLYGGTSKKQREAMIDRFQHDPQGPRLFILSLKAGGVGLNLTRANHVFHFDRWWNPAVENQATDRVFRIGQKRNVQVHKFVCSGTLEEKIHDLIESKKALAEQVVGAGENWLADLDTNQLKNLLLLDRSAIIGEE
jgi:SNF2 family DNA or RNA helicase